MRTCFSSRPRRFGKSLFLDTLKELFEGNEALFRGLHIHDKWDWSVRHPVVRLHFGAGDFTDPARLTEDVHDQLATLGEANGIAGVSKFSKVSLLSGLNNLKDITLDRRYAAVCGYAEQDLDTVFAEELAGFDRNEVRRWYNGHNWRGERVYSLFAGIPHQWHIDNYIGNFESYYAGVVYSCFAAQGFDLIPEDSSSAGRSNMVVRCSDAVYLFEFKLSKGAPEGRALAQIKKKGYADKYRRLRLQIYLIGVEFSRTQRNVAALPGH